MAAKIWVRLKNLLSLRSLRARIFIMVLLIGIVPSVLMRHGILSSYEERAVQNRIATVRNQLLIVGNHLVSNHYFSSTKTNENVINAELEMISNLYEGRVMIIDSSLKVVKDTYGLSEGKTMISEEIVRCLYGESMSNYDRAHGYIEITTPITDSGAAGGTGGAAGPGGAGGSSAGTARADIVGVLVTSISSEAIASTMEMLRHTALILQELMSVGILAAAIILSRMLTRPFGRITEVINEVQAGYSDRTVEVSDYTETVHIVEAFNQMLKRMRAMDDSRQEFVANVSHELKTPLTSVKVLADSLLAQSDAPAELYREFLTDIVSEIDRENQIITDLLALVRMEKKMQGLNIAALDINELAELILKRLRPIARKRDVELVFESMRQVTAEVDEVKLTLVMTNLVENAIKYNKEHGWVKVVLDADHQYFVFSVSDSGLGIPEEALPHIYERFYRVDKSHSRDIGGTGLGLAITKSAVLLHRGSVTVSSVEGEGSCFTVKIPLIYIADNSSAG